MIGAHGDLPWRLPADLRDFKAKTMGKPLILGKDVRNAAWPFAGKKAHRGDARKTLGRGRRSRGRLASRSGGDVIGEEEVMIGGGEQIYRLALPKAIASISPWSMLRSRAMHSSQWRV